MDTSIVQKRFKEFASRAQEAGIRIAAQVKDQQNKLTNRTKERGKVPTALWLSRGSRGIGATNIRRLRTDLLALQHCSLLNMRMMMMMMCVEQVGLYNQGREGSQEEEERRLAVESETETALKLVQYQNRALRDRLRSSANENERLHEMLKQLRTSQLQKQGSEKMTMLDVEQKQEEDVVDVLQETDGVIRAVKPSAIEKDVVAKLDAVQVLLRKKEEEVEKMKEAMGVLQRECSLADESKVKDVEMLKEQHGFELKQMKEQHSHELKQMKEEYEKMLRAFQHEAETQLQHEDYCPEEKSSSELLLEIQKLTEELKMTELEKADAINKAKVMSNFAEEASNWQERENKEKQALLREIEDVKRKNQSLEQELEKAAGSYLEDSKYMKEQNAQLERKVAELTHGIEELDKHNATLESSQREQQAIKPVSLNVSISPEVTTCAMCHESRQKYLDSLEEIERLSVSIKEATEKTDTVSGMLDSSVHERKRLALELSNSRQRIDTLEKKIVENEEASNAHLKDVEQILASQHDKDCDTMRLDHREAVEKAIELEDLLKREQENFAIYKSQTDEKLKSVQETYSLELQSVELTKKFDAVEKYLEAERKTFKEYKSCTDSIISGLKEEIAKLTSEDINKMIAQERQTSASSADIASEKAEGIDTLQTSSVHSQDEKFNLLKQIQELKAQLEDSERTHQLRDMATNVLKEEVAELKRREKRSSVDVEYIKAVLVESFALGELDSKSKMFDVIARLLQFSPEDIEKAHRHGQAKGPDDPQTSIINAANTQLQQLFGSLSTVMNSS